MSYDFDGNRRTGKECKKENCVHYEGRRIIGSGHMPYCMNCRWAHVSQYKKVEQ